ncbi:MAG: nitroreductase family protein [Myxococcota bacterium]
MTGEIGCLTKLVSGIAPEGEPHPRAARSFEREDEKGASVSEDELTALLSAARVAPSADNSQIWRFVTVRDPYLRRRLGEAAGERLSESFSRAEVVIVACAARFIVSRSRREQPFAMIDVPIAVLHLLLQAEEMGLPCSWKLGVDEQAVRSVLGVPGDVRVVAMLALGAR